METRDFKVKEMIKSIFILFRVAGLVVPGSTVQHTLFCCKISYDYRVLASIRAIRGVAKK